MKEPTDKAMISVFERESVTRSKISLEDYLAKHNAEVDTTDPMLIAVSIDVVCVTKRYVPRSSFIKREPGSTREYRRVNGDPEVPMI